MRTSLNTFNGFSAHRTLLAYRPENWNYFQFKLLSPKFKSSLNRILSDRNITVYPAADKNEVFLLAESRKISLGTKIRKLFQTFSPQGKKRKLEVATEYKSSISRLESLSSSKKAQNVLKINLDEASEIIIKKLRLFARKNKPDSVKKRASQAEMTRIGKILKQYLRIDSYIMTF